jgi:hypothetical protein
MDLNSQIALYTNQPLSYHLLRSLLKGYKRPNDKINELVKKGMLQSLKRGLYIAGPTVSKTKPEPFLLANHIWGPSYVSLDSALSHYGFIPERVYGITSVTIKNSKTFVTPAGIFSYVRLHSPYYAFGIRQLQVSDQQFALIASPEKAVCDKIINTSGTILRSKRSVLEYLTEDLRMDIEMLRTLDTKVISEWISGAPKKTSLEKLIKAINEL